MYIYIYIYIYIFYIYIRFYLSIKQNFRSLLNFKNVYPSELFQEREGVTILIR